MPHYACKRSAKTGCKRSQLAQGLRLIKLHWPCPPGWTALAAAVDSPVAGLYVLCMLHVEVLNLPIHICRLHTCMQLMENKGRKDE